MTTSSYAVDGLTCAHCVAAVTEEISALDGVQSVTVELVATGTSTVLVASATALPDEAVLAALDEAGDYRLVGAP
jgi:copper chaperone